MSRYSDFELVDDFISGKRKAFDKLFDRFHNRLFVYCKRILDDDEEAKDITLVSLHKLFAQHGIGRMNTMEHISNFLFLCARQRCLDHLRKQKRMVDLSGRFVDSLMEHAEAVNDELDVAYFAAVDKSIQNLPEKEKQVIDLLYFKKLKYREAAQTMNISESHLARLRNKSLDTLRNLLEAEPALKFIILFVFYTCVTVF